MLLYLLAAVFAALLWRACLETFPRPRHRVLQVPNRAGTKVSGERLQVAI